MENKKSQTRKKYLTIRNRFSRDAILQKSEEIINHLVKTDAFKNANTVMIYSANGSEVDLVSLTCHAEAQGKRFVYPVCLSKTEMKAYLPKGWREGAFGITEPNPERSKPVRSEEINLIICPGVSFDTTLNRLGMGGGYYDRFLGECKNAICCMVAFEMQKCDNVPIGKHDRKMDFIITEKKIYKGE